MLGYLFLEGSDSLVGTPVDSENVPAANSVTPDGSPMPMRDVGTSEIYALDVDAFLDGAFKRKQSLLIPCSFFVPQDTYPCSEPKTPEKVISLYFSLFAGNWSVAKAERFVSAGPEGSIDPCPPTISQSLR